MFDVVVPASGDTVTLSVSLSAPGFSVSPRRELPLKVARDFDPQRERVVFSLTGLEPPAGEPVTREIRADIWYDNGSIGGVTHWTTVVPKSYKGRIVAAGQSRTVPFSLSDPGRACELVIRVEGRDEMGSPPYQLSLRCRIPGGPEYESLRVGQLKLSRASFASMLRKQFAGFARSYPEGGSKAELRAWRASLLAELDTLGKWLWSKLPEKFRHEYFRLLDAGHPPASILVHSDETLIPWELVVPHRDGKARPRLGSAHVMGRWRPALGLRPRPQRVDVRKAVIANPRYGGAGFLLWSVLEAADLKAAFKTFNSLPAVTRKEMEKLLARDDVQLLHFTGHGEFSGHADLSTLILEHGETLTAMKFVGSPLLARGKPIVYLNACEVGSSGVVMGQMGGFAAQCVESGCSGIIAPYWAVSDDSARDFAIAFYGKLKTGRSVGEALRDLRRQHPKDPTYQAFTYLGDPYAQPLLS